MTKLIVVLAMVSILGRATTLSGSPAASAPAQKKQSQTPKRASSAAPAKKPTAPAPVPLSQEEAFYYVLAVYGLPPDVIDRYGKFFDTQNYQRAMADEFSRQRYREDLRSRIDSGVRKVDFNKKFIATGTGQLGEYSFGTQSFPFKRIPKFGYCLNSDHSSGICYGSLMDVDIFSPENTINTKFIQWVLPMSADAAESFVRRRQTGRGPVDRSIAVRVTYSIVSKGAETKEDLRDATFYPLVHAVEVFSDETLTEKLGALAVHKSRLSTSAEWGAAIRRSQEPSREIGQYPYVAYVASSRRGEGESVTGTITLTDVGMTISGERQSKSPQSRHVSFYNALVRSRSDDRDKTCRIIRANYVMNKTFRVVWSPVSGYDHDSPLIFSSSEERDRFFADLTRAIQAWRDEYPELITAGLDIDERCIVNTRLVTCSTTSPFEVRPSASAGAAQSQGVPPANRRAGASRPQAAVQATPPPVDPSLASLAELEAAIDEGREVPFHIKGLLVGVPYFAEGKLTVSKAAVKLRIVLGAWSSGFDVAPSKIVSMTYQPPRLHLKTAEMGLDRNMKRREFTSDYYVWHSASLVRGNISSRGSGNVVCDGCDDTMTKIHAVISKVRSTALLVAE